MCNTETIKAISNSFPIFLMTQNACFYMSAFINLFIKKYFLNPHTNIQVEQD